MGLFNQTLNEFFGSENGAFSEVTEREATGDKSITVDRHEKSVLGQRYGMDLFTRAGGVADDGKPASHDFNVFDFDTGKVSKHAIAIKYPKANGSELRLYFNRGSRFYPTTDSIWFIFTREGDDVPYIGFTTPARWQSIEEQQDLAEVFEVEKNIDDEDYQYQLQIAQPEEQKEAQAVQVFKYPRSAALAKKCIRNIGYSCEHDNSHKTFISAISGKQYVEAHHLVPVSKSEDFEHSLDVAANIVILCPNCHSAIHYGAVEVKEEYLTQFHHERSEALKASGIEITLEKLLEYYGKK